MPRRFVTAPAAAIAMARDWRRVRFAVEIASRPFPKILLLASSPSAADHPRQAPCGGERTGCQRPVEGPGNGFSGVLLAPLPRERKCGFDDTHNTTFAPFAGPMLDTTHRRRSRPSGRNDHTNRPLRARHPAEYRDGVAAVCVP